MEGFTAPQEKPRRSEAGFDGAPEPLTEAQQDDLRAVLSSVGVPVKKKPSRISGQGIVAAAGAAAFFGVSAHEYVQAEQEADVAAKKPDYQYSETQPLPKEESVAEVVYRVVQAEKQMVQPEKQKFAENKSAPGEKMETQEVPLDDEQFESLVAGHYAAIQLQKDEVLYLDEAGRPVGEPQPFVDYVDSKPGFTGEYLYTPGVVDAATGVLADVPSKEWRDYSQQQLQAQFPEQPIVDSKNVVRDFQAAVKLSDEPALVQGIQTGEVVQYDQLVSYFLEKPVAESGGLNRMEYAQQHLQFRTADEVGRPAVPEVVQTEWRRVIAGLIAQESKGNTGLRSPVTGATGLLQIMPDTYAEYRGTTDVSLSMDDQLEVAGQLISDNYHYITHFAGTEALATLQSKFASEEEFLVELIVPLMINAYNAGGPMIGVGLRQFVEQTPADELQSGRNLFVQFTEFAKATDTGVLAAYKEHAAAYTLGVEANARLLAEKYQADPAKPADPTDAPFQMAQN